MWKLENKRPNEEVKTILRRHHFVMIKAVLQCFAIIILIITCFIFLDSNLIKILVLIIGLLIAAGIFSYHYYLWYNDIYVLTTERLFDIDQHGLFTRSLNEIPLENIQEVTHHIDGPLQSIFDFGNVIIHTAGPKSHNVTIENIPHPRKVQQEISEAHNLFKTKDQISKVKNTYSKI